MSSKFHMYRVQKALKNEKFWYVYKKVNFTALKHEYAYWRFLDMGQNSVLLNDLI